MSPPRAKITQLYLVQNVPDDCQKLFALAKKCHGLGSVGALLLECKKATHVPIDSLRKTIAAIQSLGIATLLGQEPTYAQTLKADGVHFGLTKDGLKQYTKARKDLGTKFIIGTDAGGSRHEAMCLAEAGADYIAFGKEQKTKTKQHADHIQRDLVGWWAELFEVPSVALDIETPFEAQTLMKAGADFIAIKLPQEISSTNVEKFLAPFIAVLRS